MKRTALGHLVATFRNGVPPNPRIRLTESYFERGRYFSQIGSMLGKMPYAEENMKRGA